MTTAEFKKRTTHLDIPGKVYDLCQYVVKTCPICNSTQPRPHRSRVSGLRAEEFGDLIFLDHGSTKIGDKTFGFLIVLDGCTSHLTAYSCKSTSPSEVISKLHEWMDTFQMNPKAIVQRWLSIILMTCRHSIECIMKVAFRQDRTLFGQIELRWVYDCSTSFSRHSWTQPPRIWTRPLWHRSHPAQLMRKAATVRHTGISAWPIAYGVSHVKETKRSHGLSFHESRTADIYTNQTGPDLFKGDSKVGYEDTSRGPTTRRHSPTSRRKNEVCSSEKVCFTGKKIRAEFSKDGNLVNG